MIQLLTPVIFRETVPLSQIYVPISCLKDRYLLDTCVVTPVDPCRIRMGSVAALGSSRSRKSRGAGLGGVIVHESSVGQFELSRIF